MPDDKPQPLLSQAGNPFPPQLTPVFLDMRPVNGVPLERMWPRPLKEGKRRAAGPRRLRHHERISLRDDRAVLAALQAAPLPAD